MLVGVGSASVSCHVGREGLEEVFDSPRLRLRRRCFGSDADLRLSQYPSCSLGYRTVGRNLLAVNCQCRADECFIPVIPLIRTNIQPPLLASVAPRLLLFSRLHFHLNHFRHQLNQHPTKQPWETYHQEWEVLREAIQTTPTIKRTVTMPIRRRRNVSSPGHVPRDNVVNAVRGPRAYNVFPRSYPPRSANSA